MTTRRSPFLLRRLTNPDRSRLSTVLVRVVGWMPTRAASFAVGSAFALPVRDACSLCPEKLARAADGNLKVTTCQKETSHQMVSSGTPKKGMFHGRSVRNQYL